MHPPGGGAPGGFNVSLLEEGAPVEGEESAGRRVVEWALGWVLAALSSVPLAARRYGAILLAGAALAQAEATEGAPAPEWGRAPVLALPRRVRQWTLALRGLSAEELRNLLELQGPGRGRAGERRRG